MENTNNINIIRVNDSQVIADEMNPRKEFGNIKKLADSFALNAANPGEPFNPPVLVKDGEYYKIVDGERRVRAMRELGLESFNAIVCDDMDAANTMLAMVATNDKLQLTDLEMSAGVQQALLLGVAPEQVEKSLHVKNAAGIKRALDVTGEAGITLTLEHMLAIDKYSAQAERVAEIMETDAEHLSSLLKHYKDEDAMTAISEHVAAVCEAAGIPHYVAGEEWDEYKASVPEGYQLINNKTFAKYNGKIEDFEGWLTENLAECATNNPVVFFESSWGYWYARIEETVVEKNDKEQRNREAVFEEAFDTLRQQWIDFLRQQDAEQGAIFALPIKHIAMRELVFNNIHSANVSYNNSWERFSDRWYDGAAASEVELSDAEVACTGILAFTAFDHWMNSVFSNRNAFSTMYSVVPDNCKCWQLNEDGAEQKYIKEIADFRASTALMVEVGYTPNEVDETVDTMLSEVETVLNQRVKAAHLAAMAEAMTLPAVETTDLPAAA